MRKSVNLQGYKNNINIYLYKLYYSKQQYGMEYIR